MKTTLKYFLSASLPLLALISLASCSEELIDSKDTYKNFKGETGEFAYIVGGTTTEALYNSVTANIQHTTIGELGTVSKDIEVGITTAQSSAVTITLGVDETANDSGYEAFPSGVLSYDTSLTIPAGSLTASTVVTISTSNFPQLTEPAYEAVFVIKAVSGGDLEISSNSNKALLYVTTETIDPADNIIYLAGAEKSFSIQHYTNETRGDSISYDFEITGSAEAFQSFDITLKVDKDLIDAYNKANGTSYQEVPSDYITLSTVTMAQGATSAKGSVAVSDNNRGNLTDEEGYLIPVIISDVADATLSEESGVIYLVIKVVNFDYASDFFAALYLGDYRMSTWYMFPTAMDLTVDDGYTYIFHCFIDEVTRVSRIGDFADADENWINMLRFGQKGDYDTRLEWFVGPNGCRQQLYTPALDSQTWYQIALTYIIGDGYYLYVDCDLVDSYTLTDSDKTTMAGLVDPEFQAIEFNSSWGENYREGNEFHGRLWGMSVWNTVIPQSYLKRYAYKMAPTTLLNAWGDYGIYWGFDDGYGSTVTQQGGNISLGNIDFTNTTRCDDESSMVSADVSAYIQWVADENNKF